MDLIVKSPTVLLLGKEEIPIVIGKGGFRNEKREGDLGTPLGTFQLGPLFGFKKDKSFKMKYLQLQPDTVAIDDPRSRYYNQIVQERNICDKDWSSCERMGEEPLYELGAVIQYNMNPVIPGKGSAIFLHIWKNKESPTAGCIAMSRENLQKVIHSLDESGNFVVIDPSTS